MTAPAPRLVLAVALGGAAGGVLRHLAEVGGPDGDGFPWTTLTVNVVGAALLALLAGLAPVRGSELRTVALGPGLLGGFTTMSTASEQTRALLADGDTLVAASYLGLTLAAALAAVSLVSRLAASPPPSPPSEVER